MRQAFVDHPDDDLDLPAVVRRKAPARQTQKRAPKAPRKPGIGERVVAVVIGRPRQILAALFLMGCGGAIAWNALALQSSRHPAPLFNTREVVLSREPMPASETSQPLPPARPAAQPTDETVPPPAPHPVPHSAPEAAGPAVATPKTPTRSPIGEMIRNGGQPVPAAASPARAAQSPAPAAPAPPPLRSAARDPIADMIRMGGPVPVPPGNVGRSDSGDLVLAGQRALSRLGYSVKVDGVMGPGTRQAIERFEQDRHLPVTGELGTRTARELSSASGITVP